MVEKVMYCDNCERKTVHRRVSKDCAGSGSGLLRPFLAVTSLGMSEMTWSADYVCERCGECVTKSD